MLLKKIIRFILIAIFSLPGLNASSQNCSPDNFSISYEGNAAFFIFASSSTPQNDLISIGEVLQVNGGLGYDAFIAKLSGRGNFLWAKRFMLPGYNSGAFTSVAMATDSSYFVTGRFSFLKKRFTDNVIEELYAATVIAHLDQYGVPIWIKILNRFVTYFTNIEGVIKTSDGHFILSASVSSNNYSRTLVFRMDKNGSLSWAKLFYSDQFRFSYSNIRQRNNGDLIMSGLIYKNDFSEAGYHLLCIDAADGNRIFDKAYFIRNTVNAFQSSPGAIQQVSEWPAGEISFYTSISDTGRLLVPPYSLKAAMIVLDRNGNFNHATGFYNGQPGCILNDATNPDASGNQLLLMDDGVRGFVVKTNLNGDLIAQRGFGKMDPLTAPVKFISGNRIVFGGRGQVASMGLIKTENDGMTNCIETPTQVVREDISQVFVEKNIQLQASSYDKDIFVDAGGGIGRINYPLASKTICKLSCCTDVIRSQQKLQLCNVASFTLPNNHVIKESGIYDVNFHTTNGCDSIVFYEIDFLKKPIVNLGDDACLEGKDSVVLKAGPGYSSYHWVNNFSGDSTLTVAQPGIYWVEVSNICGATKDSIEIFERCDLPVHMPSGFTPNGDGLNDVFRIPPQNKNKLMSMKIFNRLGELVFETSDVSKGWDGKLKGQLQPTGVYLYVIRMKDLVGKEMIAKGSFALIR
jgi:gliding motility-associated-like protein